MWTNIPFYILYLLFLESIIKTYLENSCKKRQEAAKSCKNDKHRHVMANQLHPWPGAPAVLRIFCFGPENHILLTATKKQGLRGERGFDPPVQFGQKNPCLMNCVSTSKVSEQQKNFKICKKLPKTATKTSQVVKKLQKAARRSQARAALRYTAFSALLALTAL